VTPRFASERQGAVAGRKRKAGETHRDEGEDLGAAGIAATALDQDVVLQGFMEEQFEA